MKEILIRLRNRITGFSYLHILKPFLFRFDPESVHDRMVFFGSVLGYTRITRRLTGYFFRYENKEFLAQEILGIRFPNPIGLAAGFDKNAELHTILPEVGFGFAELGSITGEPCVGNAKPRLWRLKNSQSLGVYYGLKNDGCEAISRRLDGEQFGIPMGISVAKTNSSETVETEAGVRDYVKAFSHFTSIGSYITVNISCPNAFGGEPFTSPEKLDRLFDSLDRIPTQHPIFIKISPDLSREQVDQIITIIERHRVHGFICSNLTKQRDLSTIHDAVPEKGGLSGKVVEDLSNDLIRYVFTKTNGKYVIIGCGGVFSAEDAYKKIKYGASLVQLITGMIYQGPQLISEINVGLVRLLKKDGYRNIHEAIGREAK